MKGSMQSEKDEPELIRLIKQLNTREGDLKHCKTLISVASREEIGACFHKGYSALICAISAGYEEICELLIQKMSPEAINAVDSNGDSALTWAIKYKMNKIYQPLIEKMPPEAINRPNNQGKTPLFWAAKEYIKEAAKLILEKNLSTITLVLVAGEGAEPQSRGAPDEQGLSGDDGPYEGDI